MQKKRDFKNKFIASLIVFMLAFSNFATLGSALVSYAADDSSDVINYSAQFVMITNTQDEDQTDQHSNHQDSDITWELVDDDEDEDGKEGIDHGR